MATISLRDRSPQEYERAEENTRRQLISQVYDLLECLMDQAICDYGQEIVLSALANLIEDALDSNESVKDKIISHSCSIKIDRHERPRLIKVV